MRELERIKYLVDEVVQLIEKLLAARGTPIYELDVSFRIVRCLKRRGIDYVEQLVKLDRHDLFRIPGLGKVSVDEIMAKLAALS